jgi:hypothetical protein
MTTKDNTDRATISTTELAALLNIKPQSIYKRLCVTGSYWGINPSKLPNGRLLWPADAVEQLKKSTGKEEASSCPPLYGDQVHRTGVLFFGGPVKAGEPAAVIFCGDFCAPRAEVKQ